MLDDEVELELLNEIGFWSGWARVTWETKTRYVIEWPEFPEPLFNHVGLLEPRRLATQYLEKKEDEFREKKVNPAFFLQELEGFESTEEVVRKRGYEKCDALTVYSCDKTIDSANAAVEIRQIGRRGVMEWGRVYLRAFYGGGFMVQALHDSILRSLTQEGTRFFVAEVGGLPVGCFATYTSKGYTGAYCVGVIEEYRRRGVARAMLERAWRVASESGTRLVVQTFESDGVQKLYESLGFSRMFKRSVFVKKVFGETENKEEGVRFQPAGPASSLPRPLKVKLGVKIDRSLQLKEYTFLEAFPGFEKLPAIREIFGKSAINALKETKVVLDPRDGYLHVDNETGAIYLSQPYLRRGEEVYIYLDLIHELVHVRQFQEGKELYDNRYEYLERPTELEAYGLGVKEARRLGMTDKEIAEYLKVPWVDEDEFNEFLRKMGVNP